MEVSGRKASYRIDKICQPCKDDGTIVKAKGYCEGCDEFICKSCIKAHKKLSWTKDHIVKSKDKIPSFLLRSSPCTEPCAVHQTQIVKWYCQEHDSVLCKSCMELEHSSCNNQLLAYVSNNYDRSDQLISIKQKIYCMKETLSSSKEKIKYSMKIALEMKNEVIREIRQFRQELDVYLNNIEADIICEVDKINTNIVSTQQKLNDQCDALYNELEKFQSKLDMCKDNINNLFVTAKQLNGKLQRCEKINADISLKSQIHILKFTPSEDICQLILQREYLGKVTIQSGNSITNKKANFIEHFTVQTENDKNCFIAGMSMISEAEILCVDSKNGSLKILNIRDGKVTSTLKTPSFPADVCTINSSCAATTLPNEGKILFLNTQNGLTTSHSLNVREGCWGNDYYNGKMAVSFVKPSAVQVLDMEGHILHELMDASILTRPVRLAMSNKYIFVSDSFSDAVNECSVNGQLMSTIKSADMKLPAGLTYTNCGSVVVCYSKENEKVGIIVPGTTEILPFKLPRAIMPYSILICKENKSMYVSELDKSQDCNLIKIYELK